MILLVTSLKQSVFNWNIDQCPAPPSPEGMPAPDWLMPWGMIHDTQVASLPCQLVIWWFSVTQPEFI